MRRLILATTVALATAAPLKAEVVPADLQFFGDLFLAVRPETPQALTGVAALLASAAHNVVNFEGVVGDAFVPLEVKRHLLKMAPDAADLLAKAGIGVATLANNHAMDFGLPGLVASLLSLQGAGIVTTGAGRNERDALRPVILATERRSVCLLAFTRTLPEGFWAATDRAGTAFADYPTTRALVEGCAASGLFTVVSFHWGRELANEPLPYQREMAKLVIDAGADAVIGHHPHVMQPVEIYKKRPIFYSLGNFAFGSLPSGRVPEGAAVRMQLPEHDDAGPTFEVVPLNVDNAKVRFVPRPLAAGEHDPLAGNLKRLGCKTLTEPRRWRCESR